MIKSSDIIRYYLPLLIVLIPVLTHAQSGKTLFTKMSGDQTGIHFVNEVKDKEDLSILNYIDFYNGGGVAVGDINNDGLPDIFFDSNMGQNKLYLNEGHFHFKDITKQAGVEGKPGGWRTGVTMADVNGDGWLDIYVCHVNYRDKTGANELYINNKNGTFTEEAARYGLAHVGLSTQAVFFDYDRDGDLDMYLVDHSVLTPGMQNAMILRKESDAKAGDKLYRNDNGHFTDVTKQAGIRSSAVGYGLSASVGDVNNDGWPDIYICNDFQENDYLYYNRGNGRFVDAITQSMGHTSRSSMGSDISDINNDGRLDLMVVDMLPPDEKILKSSSEPLPYLISLLQLQAGYYYQNTRNTLQLNRGVDLSGGTLFSDISPMAGVAATDWSWAPLLCDLDNDGWKDVYITNGIQRRANDLDYVHKVSKHGVRAQLDQGLNDETLKLLDLMPSGKVSNFAFKNNGNLTFTNETSSWGLSEPSFSNGAAYADLDNDGDLDLIVNNSNMSSFIYRNNTQSAAADHHYLRVKLIGAGANTFGIGTKVYLYKRGHEFYHEEMLSRGFESSVDPVMHFGLGKITELDSVRVIWPDWKTQKLEHVKTDQQLNLHQKEAKGLWNYAKRNLFHATWFDDITGRYKIDYEHNENNFVEFWQQPLMPHLLSEEGPKLAVADINKDGLQDFYVGGAKGQPGKLFVQQKNGQFASTSDAVFAVDVSSEDIGATFFDANGDGKPDLYVVSGGDQDVGHAPALKDRLYLNYGDGRFVKSVGFLPDIYANGSCVAASDFDHDGDMDLFVGSRSVSGQYGVVPRSYLLQNDGTGHFRDVTDKLAPGLSKIGMVSDAIWTDYDGDGWPDLIVVGEWMPITIFHNEKGHFVNVTDQDGLDSSNGWWNVIKAADINGDGRVDFIAGNLGMNSLLHTSRTAPLRLYLNDFDNNGIQDPILTYVEDGKRYPLATRDELLAQMLSYKKKFPGYPDYAGKTVEQIFPAKKLRDAKIDNSYTFASGYIENLGNGKFRVVPLPAKAQLSPTYAILTGDFNGDGNKDVILAGNFDGVRNEQGRYDASYGTLLKGDGHGHLWVVPLMESGFIIHGQVRDMEFIHDADGKNLVLTAKNFGPLKIFDWTPGNKSGHQSGARNKTQ